jgi:hypothetical protein
VFVGGSGSSGTTVLARLIGQHSRFCLVPVELRFHAEASGLPGLLGGHVELGEFLERMRNHWYRYRHHRGGPRGLYRLIPEDAFNAALLEFERSFGEDRLGASRRLIDAIVDPLCEETGKPSWVEMTPQNAVAATALSEIFPEMRLVSTIRHGLDVAADKARRSKLPDMEASLDWWAKQVRRAERRREAVGAERVLLMRIEQLIRDDREAEFNRLLSFLAIDEEPAMREYFEAQMRPERATFGQWDAGLSETRQNRLRKKYRSVLEGLDKAGVPHAASLDDEAAAAADLELRSADPRRVNLCSANDAGSLLRRRGEAVAGDWDQNVRPFEEPDGLEEDPLLAEIADNGYRTQGQLNGSDPADEIKVGIRRDGRLVALDGRRRLAVARRLALPEVPVRIVIRHKQWVNFTERIRAGARRKGRLYQLIDHPDLIDIPAYHGTERPKMLSEALADYDCDGKRLLDIGTHWGYMAQQMERLGFRCTGVELNEKSAQIAERLRVATESQFTVWQGDVFEFPDAEQQDVVIAFNVFNHLIKTRELHDKLVEFLGRLSADVILFEPHLSHQPQKMEGAYRNYPPEPFAEFVAEHAGLSTIDYLGVEEDHHSPYKRPIFKISR